MRILNGQPAEVYVRQLEERGSRLDEVEPRVRQIVDEVRRRGDQALVKYARKFDGLGPKQSLRVSDSELRAAWRSAEAPLLKALRTAEKNIRQFCRWQKPKEWIRSSKGISLGQLVRPLDSVGCYVPGGRFPLVSTLLMTVIPAQATAKVSLRLVPGLEAEKVGRELERAVVRTAPQWAEVKVTLHHGGDPVQVDVSAPAFGVLDEAFESVVGRKAVQVRSGGSIPIVPGLGVGGAPVILTGIGLPDDGLHSPNEKLDLAQLWSGIEIFGRFFELFAEQGGAAASPPPPPA